MAQQQLTCDEWLESHETYSSMCDPIGISMTGPFSLVFYLFGLLGMFASGVGMICVAVALYIRFKSRGPHISGFNLMEKLQGLTGNRLEARLKREEEARAKEEHLSGLELAWDKE